ncbi:KTSC domain-containing protein [Dyadobacter psychrotolerans]|uniref:KTSC domain-containing protein n=1 Tax=Dyadobacter psychrotolerans TaxID=2541721 RepID=A0A4R5DPF3_9BACT|nr:KTSC domain-containing protein [Dyadobacter psychrotolerans]TDE15457.1 KTSC domain-containing protein [Dyadobacter psychrotolerans]
MPSSVVSKFHYNADTEILRVIYVSGMVYDYLNVPEEKYLAMKAAFSKGTFLNQQIKGNYEFRKVELL